MGKLWVDIFLVEKSQTDVHNTLLHWNNTNDWRKGKFCLVLFLKLTSKKYYSFRYTLKMFKQGTENFGK